MDNTVCCVLMDVMYLILLCAILCVVYWRVCLEKEKKSSCCRSDIYIIMIWIFISGHYLKLFKNSIGINVSFPEIFPSFLLFLGYIKVVNSSQKLVKSHIYRVRNKENNII